MRKTILPIALLIHLAINAVCQHHTDHEETSEANKYMHQSSVENLARAFDSSSRDEWQRPDELVSSLGDIENKTVVDLGSGSGYFSVRLAARGANVLAVDVNDEFIQIIEEKKQEFEIPDEKLQTVKITEKSLDLEHGSVDIVFMVNTYHHISDRVRYFREANEVLKKDGRMVIVDFYKKSIPVGPPKNHKISKEVVLSELEEAGYTSVQQDTTLLEYQYIVTATAF